MWRILFWLLAAATLAVYAAMLAWSLPTVAAAAGGLPPFDMRPAGYDLAEARSFLTALSPEGKAFYRDVQQRLDLFYPPLFSALLYFAIAALLAPWRWRWIAALPALPVAVFDWLENAAVARMLDAGPDGVSAQLVDTANRWTLLKSGLSTVAFAALLLLLVRSGWVAVRRRMAG